MTNDEFGTKMLEIGTAVCIVMSSVVLGALYFFSHTTINF